MSPIVAPELSIIIVNWNSAHFLQPCLESIYKHALGIRFEILVVDNASYDGSAEIVRSYFSDVIFIQSDANLGFSKANNLGVKYSTGSTLLFLNPDTEMLDDGIAAMYHHLQRSDQVGAVGCRMLNSDLSSQTQYIQKFPTILNQFVTADALIRWFPNAGFWSHSPLDTSVLPLAVEVLAGSCIMVKGTVFEQAGRFNESFFMYAEDVDLCYMIQKSGFKVHYIGKGTVVHHSAKSSESAKKNYFSSVMQRESLALFFRQRKGAAYALGYRVAIAVAACLRLAFLLLVIPFEILSVRYNHIAGARGKWLKVLRWSLGLEGWATTVRKGVAE